MKNKYIVWQSGNNFNIDKKAPAVKCYSCNKRRIGWVTLGKNQQPLKKTHYCNVCQKNWIFTNNIKSLYTCDTLKEAKTYLTMKKL